MLNAPPRSNTRVTKVAFNMPGTSRGRSRVFSIVRMTLRVQLLIEEHDRRAFEAARRIVEDEIGVAREARGSRGEAHLHRRAQAARDGAREPLRIERRLERPALDDVLVAQIQVDLEPVGHHRFDLERLA